MRNCIALLLIAGLFGCAAPPDLAENPDIPDAERAAAKFAAQQITKHCRYERSPVRNYYRPPVELKFEQTVRIRRLHTSSSGWFKAEYATELLDGIAYLHPASGRLVCGDELWKEITARRTVTFTEVGRK